MKKFIYKECGCSFDILGYNEQGRPNIDFDLDVRKINLDCKKTWDMISSGNTKGCFQLESRLGQMLSKKLKPDNIEHLAALISIMRPGCLEAVRDNKTVTNHFIDKKNLEEAVDYFHPDLKDILSSTYGEMIYQEQAMQIAQKLANFDLKTADVLRKAIGKKQPEEMKKLKSKFIKGCVKNQLEKRDAEELFGWIEKSQRYSFNKSHAVSYAFNAYLSAFAKSHFPKIFFLCYLKFAEYKIDPQKEMRELINNAKDMDINVMLPDLRLLNDNFKLINREIYFGLSNVKNFGKSVYDKLCNRAQDYDIQNMSYIEIIIKILSRINITASKSIISCGAMDFTKQSRNYLLLCLEIISNLSDRERLWIEENISFKNFQKLSELLNFLATLPTGKKCFCSTKKRKEKLLQQIELLKNPPFSVLDSIEWISDKEFSLLGVSLSCSKIDGCDISVVNTYCSDIRNDSGSKNPIIGVQIDEINVIKTKKGKAAGSQMCFITASDSTGSIDNIVCFPEEFALYREVLIENNTVIIQCQSSKEKNGLIIKKLWQA